MGETQNRKSCDEAKSWDEAHSHDLSGEQEENGGGTKGEVGQGEESCVKAAAKVELHLNSRRDDTFRASHQLPAIL